MSLIELKNADVAVDGHIVVAGADLRVLAGESLAIVGPSGSGKTTLLHTLSGLYPPAAGSVMFDGGDLSALSHAERDRVRLSKMGMVFQFAELLPELTAVENAALPSRYLGATPAEATQRAREWLDRLGIGEHADAYPDAMSGGQIQRVAIARAVAHGPQVVLADEPTGMLDTETSRDVASTLFSSARTSGAALIIVTHDPDVAVEADRTLRLSDGKLVES